MGSLKILLASLLSLLPLLFCTGCGGKNEEPPTIAELTQACQDWASAGCQKDMECVGLAGTLDACVKESMNKCVRAIDGKATSCSRPAVDAIEGCTPRLIAKSCADYCSTTNGSTFCYAPCPYICAISN